VLCHRVKMPEVIEMMMHFTYAENQDSNLGRGLCHPPWW